MSSIAWLVETAEITEEEGERLLEFHRRSASKRLAAIATARQRRVGEELNRYYQKTPDSGFPPQSVFLLLMNGLMQGGTTRLEAEKKAVRAIREMTDEDLTPLPARRNRREARSCA